MGLAQSLGLLPAGRALSHYPQRVRVLVDDASCSALDLHQFLRGDAEQEHGVLDAVPVGLEEHGELGASLLLVYVVGGQVHHCHASPVHFCSGSMMAARSRWACWYRCPRLVERKSSSAPATHVSILRS